ncbi:HD family phosphohydrolase [Ornithinibacillus halophilus]|uniref:HD domain-containing protein n=1 Tax=Ornithinibacillus halophilus TaxID=930117 RepID=A0A1M5DMI3_9BACI|nr:HD family phosphohydrolase [Ornithinibacillus halophilus]SHF68238.1 hypothetical protein SAMN05216225_1002133 [Ornithinibacillus halophilus]
MKERIDRLLDFLFKIRKKSLTIILPAFILGVIFFIVTVSNVFMETFDIEKFSDAKQTIRSPITIEHEIETDRKSREAINAVDDRYSISNEVTNEQIGYIEEIFDAIDKVEEENVVEDEEANETPKIITNQDKINRLKQLLSNEITDKVSDSVFLRIIQNSPEQRARGKEILLTALTETFESGVRVENKNSAISNVKDTLTYTTLDENLIHALKDLAGFAVVENSFFDADKTEEARKEAANNVDPVIINAGEVIVREGQIITNEIYDKLSLVGLLDEEHNEFPVIGLILLVGLLVCIVAYEMNVLDRQDQLDKGKIFSIVLISLLVVILMKVVSLYTTLTNQLYFVVPVATGVLLVKLLINERLAIVLASIYAIVGSIIFNGQIPGSLNVEAGLYFFFSQLAAIIFLMNVKDRFTIVKSGFGMSIINIITLLVFLLLSFEKYSLGDFFILGGFALASAFLSAVLTIGFLPFFESGLGILSDIKLLHLANPNQPILKKILTEAPGTYHHSIMVANLSETACEAIGANGLLARVGAYYHDIGKTERPHYFIENQLSIKNPHDVISPKQSAEIIISHPYDGAKILKKHKLPKEIIDIATQHHGTTLLKYFYYKEKEKNPNVKEEDYRYPGPKPQTKEAAIICICDSVEAAVRSLKEPTEEKIEEIVSSIVNDRLMDGQLDECPLTISEVKVIHETICETLKGIFHSRIQYPMKEAK